MTSAPRPVAETEPKAVDPGTASAEAEPGESETGLAEAETGPAEDETEPTGAETEPINSPAVTEDDQEEETKLVASPLFEPVVLPRISVEWSSELITRLAAVPRQELYRPLAELTTLAALLDRVAREAEPGCLTPDGVRWSAEHGWQLLLAPPYGIDGRLWRDGLRFDERARPIAWQRDLSAIAIALLNAAVGYRPATVADGRRLADVDAGELPHGFDTLINLLLRNKVRTGDTSALHSLADALARGQAEPPQARCFMETGVGSGKARGRSTLDNEDAAGAEVPARGGVRLAIFDGTTGAGDGSGRTAAYAALECVTAEWRRDVDSPRTLLAKADNAVTKATPHGCTTAVIAAADPAGHLRIASLGDSSAWLVRRGHHRTFHAWRLTPVHTRYAEAVRTRDELGGYSEITRFLGGAAGSPYHGELTICDGDLLVLATDGATVEGRGTWFGDLLCELADEHANDDRPLGAILAAELVSRAEHAGGFDNATVLIADFLAV